MKATSMLAAAAMSVSALGCQISGTPAEAQTSGPASGYYMMAPLNHAGNPVAVLSSANAGGSSVVSEVKTNAPSEYWLLKQQGNGSYKVYAYSAKNSLQMLDLSSASSSTPLAVTGEDDVVDGTSDATQRWSIVPVTGGYQILPYNDKASGTAVLTMHSAVAPATYGTLQMEPPVNGRNQTFALTAVASPPVLFNPKKGIPTGSAGLDKGAVSMHCSWTYNWSTTKDSGLASSIEFVPMVWGWNGDTNIGNEVLAQNPNMKEVLGYNEPDEPNSVGGSDMTVDNALQGFQYISALKSDGITIGGPACAVDTDDWMSSFMSQATAAPYSYNIDFIGFHDYAGESNVYDAAYGYLGFLDAVYKQYNLPIWATEFAPTNLAPSDVPTFIRIVCQGLESRSYVVRYSMFTSEAPAASGMGDSALVNSDGSLTAAGNLYARM